MKKAFIAGFLVLLMPALAGAIIFENSSAQGEIIAPGIAAARLDAASVRINGKGVLIKRYESTEPVKKVLEAFLAESEKQGGWTVNNQFLWLAANALFTGAAGIADPVSYGYIFTIDKKNRGEFVVAGSDGKRTEIIRSDFENYAGGSGYDDGISHFPAAKRVLSIELLSGARTVNFGNFYMIKDTGRMEIRNYYISEFKKDGLEILKKQYTEECDHFMLKGKNRELLINLSPQKDGGMLVFVMG